MNHWIKLIDADKKSKNHLDATPEQIYDCVSLLALSIVHHRTKFGIVPFEYTAIELGNAEHGPVSHEVLAEGRRTLEEALEFIKAASTLSSKQQPEAKAPKIKLEEKRQQIRINVSAPIQVILENSTTPLKAKLENISWGGAALCVEQDIGEVEDFIHIELPSFRGRHIRVEAQIVRIMDSHDGPIYSVRFSKLQTADENVFEQLLEFLADSGDDTGQRKNVRLTQRIDIQYDDINELQATLEDISAGGLGITVPEPMELNQSLLAVISTTDESCQLVLRARVVRQQELESSSIKLFRVGLEFEHPTEDLKDRIKKLIQTMASANPANKFEIL